MSNIQLHSLVPASYPFRRQGRSTTVATLSFTLPPPPPPHLIPPHVIAFTFFLLDHRLFNFAIILSLLPYSLGFPSILFSRAFCFDFPPQLSPFTALPPGILLLTLPFFSLRFYSQQISFPVRLPPPPGDSFPEAASTVSLLGPIMLRSLPSATLHLCDLQAKPSLPLV